MRTLIDRVPPRFKWTFHNLVAHPVGELMYQIGLGWRLDADPQQPNRLGDLSDKLHDATVPTHTRGEGRG